MLHESKLVYHACGASYIVLKEDASFVFRQTSFMSEPTVFCRKCRLRLRMDDCITPKKMKKTKKVHLTTNAIKTQ